MIKKLLLLMLLLKCSAGFAETIRTDVLVIGGGASGVAAAVQSARSNVKTLLIVQGSQLGGGINDRFNLYNTSLASGIYAEFGSRIREFYRSCPGYDSSRNVPLMVEPEIATALIKKMTDTAKNLTVKLNTSFKSIKKDGIGWVVTVTIDGRTAIIKAKLLVDATEKIDVAAAAASLTDSVKVMVPYDRYMPYNRGSQLYRTAIAVGDGMPGASKPFPAHSIPLGAVVAKDQDNLLITGKVMSTKDPSVQMSIGQGVGATAAYCIFFNTTTKNLKPRIIQGEILDHKGMLLPFADIKITDRDYRAIQQVGATGLLHGMQKVNGNRTDVLFMPDILVRTAEIKPFLNEIYSRSFLWFNSENPGELFTLANLLSYISEITLRDPVNLQDGLRKTWKTYYHFPTDFNPNRPATRREFAVLANRFLNPFARKVDMSGRLVN
ncbi:FAD-dependent oxidoreductase [Mucilaginibacter lutimaris]|uniref:FAD-dependent oxidoreductase n=1 Tax=Mucilaginibacter lutimaris TaxID=931629 RepID=A0ABW2ZJH0_9SPHI